MFFMDSQHYYNGKIVVVKQIQYTGRLQMLFSVLCWDGNRQSNITLLPVYKSLIHQLVDSFAPTFINLKTFLAKKIYRIQPLKD